MIEGVEARLGTEKLRGARHPNTAAALAESRHRRRGVRMDYAYYDPPETIYRFITAGRVWPYRFSKAGTQLLYTQRDRAAMALEYLSTTRATEMVRGDTVLGHKLSIKTTQFNRDDPEWLKLRDVLVIKHLSRKLAAEKGLTLEDAPRRIELKFPRFGDLSRFTKLIEDYLDTLEAMHPKRYAGGMELFGFGRGRLYTLVNYTTGRGCHYLRAQGLKLMSYLMVNNIANLKRFSGHSQTDSLLMYLSDVEYEKAMLSYKSPDRRAQP